MQRLLKEMEELFTARFGGLLWYPTLIAPSFMISQTAKGDRKRALVRLRTVSSFKTHHFSTFRTGAALGLAFPAIVDGLVRCESSDIPRWSLNLLQASSPTRAIPYRHGAPYFIYMQVF